MADDFHRISAAALRNRGLVKTSGHGPTWNAKITHAGLEYLKQVDGEDPPMPRQPNVSVTQQLVDEVIAAGGVMRVPRCDRHHPERVDYERRVQSAQRLGKVPDGKRFELSYDDTEIKIQLVDAPMASRVELAPVVIPERIGRYHKAAREFRDRSDRHEVSRDQLARATRIVHAIAAEAEHRGWTVSVSDEAMGRSGNGWTATKYGHVQLAVNGELFWLRLQEEGAHTRGPREQEVRHYRTVRDDDYFWRNRKVPRDPYDADCSGRLQLTLHASRGWVLRGRQSRFGDRHSWTLETRLPHLFREIEERIVELQQYDEANHIEAERKAEAARLAAEERARHWRQLMARAKQRLLEDHLAAHAQRQADAWRTAGALREYCNAVESAHGTDSGSAEWISWIRAHADRVDPLAESPRMPAPPAESGEALQRYLPDDWSAEGPEHDPRSHRSRW